MRWGLNNRADHIKWFSDIKAYAVNLTQWEKTFLASVHNKFERGYALSESEANKLEQIYAERTP